MWMAASKFVAGFVVARRDRPELLESAEEILDQVALFIEFSIERFGRGGITADLPTAAKGSSTRLSASKARSAIRRLAVICGSSASAPAKSCVCPGVSRQRRGLQNHDHKFSGTLSNQSTDHRLVYSA
jgi:hypothetical protein